MFSYLAIAVVLVVGFMFIKSRGQKLSLEEVMQDLDNGGVLVDVRTAAEFRTGHAKGAKNVSLQSIQTGTMPSKDKQQAVYLYCHSGARAASASLLLKRVGYDKVISLGGLNKWRKMGGDVVS